MFATDLPQCLTPSYSAVVLNASLLPSLSLPSLRLVQVCPESQEASAKYVLSWRKFVELHNLLDAGLKDITQTFTSGKSAFAGNELRGFIKAIFTNSDLRASCLAKLN